MSGFHRPRNRGVAAETGTENSSRTSRTEARDALGKASGLGRDEIDGFMTLADIQSREAVVCMMIAAPELLAACRRAVSFMCGDHRTNGIVGVDAMLAMLRAAIALATHRSI